MYSPPATGTSTSSVPFNPSAIKIGHPTVSGVNPFSHAHSKCSNAFFLFPGYPGLPLTLCSFLLFPPILSKHI